MNLCVLYLVFHYELRAERFFARARVLFLMCVIIYSECNKTTDPKDFGPIICKY